MPSITNQKMDLRSDIRRVFMQLWDEAKPKAQRRGVKVLLNWVVMAMTLPELKEWWCKLEREEESADD